jgi:ribosomal protein L18
MVVPRQPLEKRVTVVTQRARYTSAHPTAMAVTITNKGITVSAAEAKHETAVALYQAIQRELEKIRGYGRASSYVSEVEKLAHAYSMVAETNVEENGY